VAFSSLKHGVDDNRNSAAVRSQPGVHSRKLNSFAVGVYGVLFFDVCVPVLATNSDACPWLRHGIAGNAKRDRFHSAENGVAVKKTSVAAVAFALVLKATQVSKHVELPALLVGGPQVNLV